MAKKTTVKSFNDPVFGFNYFVAFGNVGYDDMIKLQRSLDLHEECDFDNENSYGLCFTRGDTIFIWVDKKSNIPTLSHECFHALRYVTEAKGIEMSSYNDEAPAYYMGFLMRECLK